MADADILDQVWEPSREEIEGIYEQAGKKFDLNPALLRAQNAYELGPGGNSHTAGDSQHVGYGQLGPELRKKYKISDATDPHQTIPAQAAELKELLTKHEGNVRDALTEYTGGPNTKIWGVHTRAYADQVLKNFPQGESVAYTAGNTAAQDEGDILDKAWDDPYGNAANPNIPQARSYNTKPYEWNGLKSLVNGLNLGFGPEEHGIAAATRGIISRLAGGEDLSSAIEKFPIQYRNERDWAREGQKTYAEQNPLSDLLYGAAGSLIPTAAALGTGQAEAVAPLAEGLSAAAPRLSSAIDFATGNIAKSSGVRNWLARRASQALTGAVAGGGAAALQSHMSDRPLGDQMRVGAETGGVLSPVISSAIEPLLNYISPMAAHAASRLKDLGVDVRAGQLPGASPALRFLNNTFGDGGESSREALTQAAARTVGSNSPVLTKDIMNGVEDRLRTGFEGFANSAKNANLHDPILQKDLIDIMNDAAGEPITSDSYKELQKLAKLTTNNGAGVNGADYLQLTKRGSPLDRAMRHPEIGEHAINMRDALDDSLERAVSHGFGKWVPATKPVVNGMARLSGPYNPTASATARAFTNAPIHPPSPPPRPGMEWEYSPGTQGLVDSLKTLRSQWKNMKTISSLIDDTTGQIVPSALAARVDKSFKRLTRSNPAQPSKDLMALGEGNNFMPDTGHGNAMTRLWDKLGTGGHVGLGALGGAVLPELIHEMPALEANWKPAAVAGALGVMGYGAGKAVNAAANSQLNTSRVLANALAGREPSAGAFVQATTIPATNLWNAERSPHGKYRSNGKHVEYQAPGESEWRTIQ